MPVIKHNPPGLFPQYCCYSHAIEIRGDSRLLVISGLNGYLSDGITMPDSFEEQGDIVWTHLGTILQSAGMNYQDWSHFEHTWRTLSMMKRTYVCAPSI